MTFFSHVSGSSTNELKQMELPKFSPLVEKCLVDKRPEVVWNQFIAETATHYFSKLMDNGEPNVYRHIGERMYMAYPCIRMEGIHAWVSRFTN